MCTHNVCICTVRVHCVLIAFTFPPNLVYIDVCYVCVHIMYMYMYSTCTLCFNCIHINSF